MSEFPYNMHQNTWLVSKPLKNFFLERKGLKIKSVHEINPFSRLPLKLRSASIDGVRMGQLGRKLGISKSESACSIDARERAYRIMGNT